ncbi:MAG: transposase [Acidobacteriota bacterium]|nr:transposase [Acidobacteriota bacterium]
MKSKELLDLYSDYLLASFGATTATGLSHLVDNLVSHDQITRFLASETQTAKDLWHVVKPLVRKVQSKRAVLIIDDTIEEKPYTDENEIVCWHFDHSKDRSIKGINFVSALYEAGGVSLPVGFQVISKTEHYIDKKTQKEKRRSPVTKNEICRQLIKQAIKNELPFEFVLFDSWFAAAENMKFIKTENRRDFICPLKSNRKVALSLTEKLQGRYQAVETLNLELNITREIYLEGVEFPLALAKQVFTNEDGCFDTTRSVERSRRMAQFSLRPMVRKPLVK